jgi:nucleoid DNA-binding protein
MPKKTSSRLTKAQVIAHLAEACELNKKQTECVMSALTDLIIKELKKDNDFAFNGLFVIRRTNVAAKPARMVRNPATGQQMMAAAKPASRSVRIRALKTLKESV